MDKPAILNHGFLYIKMLFINCQDKTQVQLKPEVKEKPPLKYEFFDPGGHWCRSCNVIAGNVFNFFSHLQGKKHQKVYNI